MGSEDEVLRLLVSVRDQLGMEVAFVSRFDADSRELVAVAGSATAGCAPARAGRVDRLVDTYCEHLIAGRLPAVLPDTRAHPVTAVMPITRELGIGSYVGVPVHTPDGELFGTLCAFRARRHAGLSDRDTRFLRVVADAVGGLVARPDPPPQRDAALDAALAALARTGGPAVALQPIVRLADLEVVGAEALARFPARGPAPWSTAEWFSRAAAAGRGTELELRALERALPLVRELPGLLSVNASPSLVAGPGLQRLLTGLPLGRLVLEVTEHTVVTDYERLHRVLAPLRAAGLRLAVDDAGAGYASLRHVLELAPDIVKLDASLTAGIATDTRREALAAALVAFAERTGTEVIAEGVETALQRRALHDLGVVLGQGYHLGRPRVQLPRPRRGGLDLPGGPGSPAGAPARWAGVPARCPGAPGV